MAKIEDFTGTPLRDVERRSFVGRHTEEEDCEVVVGQSFRRFPCVFLK